MKLLITKSKRSLSLTLFIFTLFLVTQKEMSTKQNEVLFSDLKLFRLIRQKHTLGFKVPIYLRHVDLLWAPDMQTFSEKYAVMCSSCVNTNEFTELTQTFEKYKEYVSSISEDLICQHIVTNGFDRHLEYKVKIKELQLITITAERFDGEDELSIVHQFNDIVEFILSFEDNVHRIDTTITNDKYVATISRELVDPDFVDYIGQICFAENNRYKTCMLTGSIYLGDCDIDYEFDDDYSDGD